MRTLIIVAASVVINAVALGGMQLSVRSAQQPPRGEVSVTQISADSDLALYSRANGDLR